MSIGGTLESGALQEFLRRIAASEARGLLSIQGEQDLVSITFERGSIVAADAMNHPAEEMLGEVLANEGWLSPADFHEALEAQPPSGRLASVMLAEAGVVENRILLRAVRLQTYRQALRVLRWRAGNFDWTPDVESAYHDGVEPLSIAELLLRATEELGSEGPLTGTIPELDTVFEKNPDRQVVVRDLEQAGHQSAALENGPDVAWLSRQERKLLEAIDGRQPGSLLMLQSGLDPYQVKYSLHALARSGLIRVSHQVSADNPLHATLATGVRSTDILDTIEPWEESGSLRVGDLGSGSLRLDEGVLQASEVAPAGVSPEPSVQLDADPGRSGAFRGGLASTNLEELLEAETESAAVQRPVRKQRWSDVASPWLARALALAMVALLAATAVLPRERSSLLLPFSWLAADREALDREQRTAIHRKIERAIRTYHLIYGRYPEDLTLLADLQLLAQRADLHDPQGRGLVLTRRSEGYLLQAVQGGELQEPAEVTSFEQDFLINPRYAGLESSSFDRAVVLLD